MFWLWVEGNLSKFGFGFIVFLFNFYYNFKFTVEYYLSYRFMIKKNNKKKECIGSLSCAIIEVECISSIIIQSKT